MKSDFDDSCQRHWDDAEILFTNDRWANADHLYGFSAEGALKCLMLAFGMPFDVLLDKPERSKDARHIELIWDRYESYHGNQHPAGTYTLSSANPFSDWHASQRYANQNHFSRQIAEKHRDGAKLAKDVLKQAKIDGVVT